jgi:hypothetical protein
VISAAEARVGLETATAAGAQATIATKETVHTAVRALDLKTVTKGITGLK